MNIIKPKPSVPTLGGVRKRPATARAFTLIELLVVVAIIAILAGLAVPGAEIVRGAARRAAATHNVKQILLGLRAYSNDSGGVYPAETNTFGEPIQNANDAFRDILEYTGYNEEIFVVPGSAWGARADQKTASPDQMLRAGENHFAYIEGLSPDARGQWPLVVDGTNGSGTYTAAQGERGGVWKGQYAIVGRLDGSAASVRLKGSDATRRYLPKFDDPAVNGLNVSAYMGNGVRLLDPAAGGGR
jgi:prepilin-type N-terminal cleavage/methylation domain-containing protein